MKKILILILFFVIITSSASAATISYGGAAWTGNKEPSFLTNVIDRDYTTVSYGTTQSFAQSGAGSTGFAYIQIDIGSIVNVSDLTIKVGHQRTVAAGTSVIDLQYSTDGSSWTTANTFTTGTTTETINQTNTVIYANARYVRSSAWSATSLSEVRWYEIQINSKNVLNTTMNEGTGTWANDTSGFNNNGTITGATWTTDSVNGSALSFDGNDIVTIPTSASLNFTDKMSWSGWFKLTQTPTSLAYVYKKGSSMYRLYITAGSKTPTLEMSGVIGSNNFGSLTLNKTYYLTFTYDSNGGSGNFNTYKDGVLVSSLTTTGTINTDSGSLYFGSDNGANGVNAVIDEWKFYNYVLNSTERTTDYQRFQPVPAYPTGGLTITATYPPMTQSVNFTWHDTEYPADELIVAKDSDFNIVVTDVFTSNDYYAATLDIGQTYYWKVRQYNGTTATYGDTSQTETFTVSSASPSVSGTNIYGIIYEIVDGINTPISGAKVRIWNNDSTTQSYMVTGSNGYYQFIGLSNNTTYFIQSSKVDIYEDSSVEIVTTGAGTSTQKDILMQKCVSGFNCFYNKKYVDFYVTSPLGDEYTGVTVSVYEGSASAATYIDTTGDDGGTTFLLKIGQKYTVTFVKVSQSINEDMTISIRPKGQDDSYTLYVWGSNIVNRNDNVSWSFTTSDNNATTSWLNFTYNSNTTTTYVNFWVKNESGVLLYSSNHTSTTGFTDGYAVNDSNGLGYVWGMNASHPVWGFIDPSKTIRFRSTYLIDMKFSDTRYYTWISVIFLIGLSLLFSRGTNKFGYIIVPFFALLFWSAGWFPPGYDVRYLGIIVTTLIIGIFAYSRASEKQGGYQY